MSTIESYEDSRGGSGSVLIIPDVPIGLDFGINCMSFETGPKFRGMSLIPQGLHFVYHSTGMAARQGFFWRAGLNDVAVRPWNSFEEHICANNVLSDDSMDTLLQHLKRGDLNNNLGPYPLAEHHIWINLSCFISENVLQRANCSINEIIYPSEAEDLAVLNIGKTRDDSKNTTKKDGEMDEGKDKSNDIKNKKGGGRDMSLLQGNFVQYIDVSKEEMNLRDDINASDSQNKANELTLLYLDKSIVLESLITKQYNSYENILGELQLSFLMFLLIFCYDSLEHWKKLLDTICRSEKALLEKPEFTIAFMRIIYEQLNFSPADFFQNELSKDNFLKPALACLFDNLNGLRNNGGVKEHKKRLLNFISKKFSISLNLNSDIYEVDGNINDDIDNYMDENKPVVVSVDELKGLGMEIYDTESNIEINPATESENAENEILGDNIVDGDEPVPMDEPEPLSASEIEIGMFSWRYPNLYDILILDNLNEDFEMVSIRILSEMEDNPNQSKIISESLRLARIEAKMFIEDEVSRRTQT
jgi:A1 cistron-splicing factor AAR2